MITHKDKDVVVRLFYFGVFSFDLYFFSFVVIITDYEFLI